MINYSNAQRYYDMSFEDYLKLPGLSHSFLKREKFGFVEELTITDNITIGKLTDAILMDPVAAQMEDPLYKIARSVAVEIHKSFGSIIPMLKRQVSFTADVECNGLVMRTKGRTDWLLEDHAIIDLKVTKSKDIKGLIVFMGYENQLWHYAKGLNVKDRYLLIHSIPLKRNFLQPVTSSLDTNEFWAEKCTMFGRVAA